MDSLMRSAHLLATDPLFRVAYGTDPESTLAERGLTLTLPEFRALRRVWASISDRGSGGELPSGVTSALSWG